ncbi:MAG: hypothetical protein HY815_10415 [Candidatus Riflebacteria bacterium]|nr:hypothetical protein [Candidatus Riflebacteria bacterium]
MADRSDIQRELDAWLAEGRIDQETHGRLSADASLPRPPQDPTGHGLLMGAGGIALGLGLCYLVGSNLDWSLDLVGGASLLLCLLFGWVGTNLTRGGPRAELGRCLAIVSSLLWIQAVACFALGHLEPGARLSPVFLVLSAGLFLLAYLSTSAVVLFEGTLMLCDWMAAFLGEQPWFQHGIFLAAFALLGTAYLVVGRQHLLTRWPAGPPFLRFALVYQLVGLNLINWSTMILAWTGWTGDGYGEVAARLVCVTMTVLLYGLEVWAGRKSGLSWITAIGVYHFLLQILAILYYPHLSIQSRAAIVIVLGLIMIFTALGEGGARSRRTS